MENECTYVSQIANVLQVEVVGCVADAGLSFVDFSKTVSVDTGFSGAELVKMLSPAVSAEEDAEDSERKGF